MNDSTTPAADPAALTSVELDVLRFAPEAGNLCPSTLKGHAIEVEGLAARGLLTIRGRHFWGIDYKITSEGTALVWDNAPACLFHLRPAGV